MIREGVIAQDIQRFQVQLDDAAEIEDGQIEAETGHDRELTDRHPLLFRQDRAQHRCDQAPDQADQRKQEESGIQDEKFIG